MNTDLNTLLEIAGMITAFGGACLTIWNIFLKFKKNREYYRKSILSQAKLEMDKIQIQLEDKIKALEVELAVQKENVAKDISFMKETQTAEIANLANKIQDIREQLNTQHAQLVALLTKLVDSGR